MKIKQEVETYPFECSRKGAVADFSQDSALRFEDGWLVRSMVMAEGRLVVVWEHRESSAEPA